MNNKKERQGPLRPTASRIRQRERHTWHFTEQGRGRPLVLLHGFGMTCDAWKPVLPLLAQERRVFAFDIPGFGATPSLPSQVAPSTRNLVLALVRALRDLGITLPVDIAGHSLGGWMALEAARMGMARSIVAISPAGLWEKPPVHMRLFFFSLRRLIRSAPELVSALLRVGPLRELCLAVPLSAGGWRISASEAIAAAHAFEQAPGLEATFEQGGSYRGGRTILVPVTAAFGTQDWLLTRSARLRQELPAHTRWLEPEGWGHVPMWNDPQGVAHLILQGTR